MDIAQSLDWLRLMSFPDNYRERIQAEIVAVPTNGSTCCAIRADGRWLTGQTNPLIFANPAAAEKFLDLVGVSAQVTGETARLQADCWLKHSCYRLSPLGGLGPCPQKKSAHQYFMAAA